MAQLHTRRDSQNPYIERVWHSINQTDGIYISTPDGSWDVIVMIDTDGSRRVMLAGQASEPMRVPYRAGTEGIVISFVPSAYLPHMPAKEMLNYAEFLPSEGPDHFVLAGRVFPIPTYESAEQLVELMVAAGVVRLDDVVGAALDPKSYAGDRTAQRHFKQTTGLTRSFLGQIRRAQEAVKQLQSGKKPADVAADLGYTDQAHLYKSIRRIMNTRPTDVDHINKV